MNYKRFYSEIGKLLYAVADMDGKISQKEKETIHQLIQERLVKNETHYDEFNTNIANYAEFEFEVAEEQGMSVREAFTSFMHYINNHLHELDHTTKSTILFITEKIARAYHGTNKTEQKMLAILRSKLITADAAVQS